MSLKGKMEGMLAMMMPECKNNKNVVPESAHLSIKGQPINL